MEDTLKKRKRTENYTFEETYKLLECVRRYQHIVENKKTDSFTWKQKDQAWEKISQEYNSCNTNIRTTKMLRGKFETLKKEARKYAAAQRQNRLHAPSKIKSNFILDIVQEIISIECLPSVLDTDKMPEASGTEADSNADTSCVAAETIPELLSFEMDLPVISSDSQPNCGYICEPQEKSSQRLPSVAEVASLPGMGTCTQCNRSCHTKAPSRDDQKLNLNAAEKFDVAILQQQLLRERFAQREKRDQEIHEYNIQIKKTELEIKKAELINLRLDTKIKKKAIKKLEDAQ